MRKVNSLIRLTFVIFLMTSLISCGQKGNLYLPEGITVKIGLG